MRLGKVILSMLILIFSCTVTLPQQIVNADFKSHSAVAIQSGDHIYYVNQTNQFLYSVKEDGSDIKLLSEDKVSGDITIKGNWIYYGTQTNKIIKSKYYNQIFKIKTDGSQKVKLADLEAYSTYIDCIEGSYIYFTKTSLRSGDTKLYRVTTGGKKLSELASGAYDVAISGKKIYYHVLYGGGPNLGSLRSMNLDGTDKKVLRKNVTKFIPLGNDIIYTMATTEDDNIYTQYLKRLNIETNKDISVAKLGETRIREITAEGIYYTSNSKFYRMDNRTGNIIELTTLLGDFSYGGFHISSDTIYYVDATSTTSTLYTMGLDGTQKTIIYNIKGDIAYVEAVGSKVFFVERSYENNQIKQCYYDQKTEQVIKLN